MIPSHEEITKSIKNNVSTETPFQNNISFRETGTIPESQRDSYIHSNGDGTKDYGRYGVNEATLSSYGEQFLGQKVTPEEFLKSRQLQDKFINSAEQHLTDLGAKKPERMMALWRKGWGDVSTKRVNSLMKDPDVIKYINNKPLQNE